MSMLEACASFSASVIASLCVPFFFLQCMLINIGLNLGLMMASVGIFGPIKLGRTVNFQYLLITWAGQESGCCGPQDPSWRSQQPAAKKHILIDFQTQVKMTLS